jgi:NADH-dependent peroxiredoxin subunit F
MTYDLAIIGGGPAGVAGGVYASRKRLKTIFITKDWNGQSSVSDGIENWIGTVKISGLELAKNLENHLKAYANKFVDIKEGEICEEIKKDEKTNNFIVKTNKDEYEVKTILITTGSHRRKLDVPGADRLEHKGLTYCASCDGPLFANQDVAVIGGGNAAFESTAQLLAYCKSVTLINRSKKFRADPKTIEAVSKNKHFKILTNAVPKEVKGDNFVSSFVYTDLNSKEDIELNVSGIFVEIGSIPTTGFAKNLLDLDQFGHIITDPKNQHASIIGVWAAGDCTDGLYHQNNIAAGDAVKAIEDIYLFLKAK